MFKHSSDFNRATYRLLAMGQNKSPRWVSLDARLRNGIYKGTAGVAAQLAKEHLLDWCWAANGKNRISQDPSQALFTRVGNGARHGSWHVRYLKLSKSKIVYWHLEIRFPLDPRRGQLANCIMIIIPLLLGITGYSWECVVQKLKDVKLSSIQKDEKGEKRERERETQMKIFTIKNFC